MPTQDDRPESQAADTSSPASEVPGSPEEAPDAIRSGAAQAAVAEAFAALATATRRAQAVADACARALDTTK
jgi:cell pole-organizing protein PopZ